MRMEGGFGVVAYGKVEAEIGWLDRKTQAAPDCVFVVYLEIAG